MWDFFRRKRIKQLEADLDSAQQRISNIMRQELISVYKDPSNG